MAGTTDGVATGRRGFAGTAVGTGIAAVTILGAFAIVWLLRAEPFPNGGLGLLLVAVVLAAGTATVARRLGGGTALVAGLLFVANLLLFLALHPEPHWKDSLRSLDDFGMVRWGWMPVAALLAGVASIAAHRGRRRALPSVSLHRNDLGEAFTGLVASAFLAVVVLVGSSWVHDRLASTAAGIALEFAFVVMALLLALGWFHSRFFQPMAALLGFSLGAWLLLFAIEMPSAPPEAEDDGPGYPWTLIGPAFVYGLILVLGLAAPFLASAWERFRRRNASVTAVRE